MRIKRKNKNRLLLIGSFFLLSGFIILSIELYQNIKLRELEKEAINKFYVEEEIIDIETIDNNTVEEETIEDEELNYIGIIKIPKINLERGLVSPYSYQNNVDKNIAFVEPYTLPDKQYGNVILASHSGNSSVSFFRKLDKLSINDEIIIDFNKESYFYKVVNIYDVEKTGKAVINRNRYKNTLTLITCRDGTNKQIIVISELERKEKWQS